MRHYGHPRRKYRKVIQQLCPAHLVVDNDAGHHAVSDLLQPHGPGTGFECLDVMNGDENPETAHASEEHRQKLKRAHMKKMKVHKVQPLTAGILKGGNQATHVSHPAQHRTGLPPDALEGALQRDRACPPHFGDVAGIPDATHAVVGQTCCETAIVVIHPAMTADRFDQRDRKRRQVGSPYPSSHIVCLNCDRMTSGSSNGSCIGAGESTVSAYSKNTESSGRPQKRSTSSKT